MPKSPVVKRVAFSFKPTKALVKGSSSLHAWESNVTQMEGKGSFETIDDELVAVKDVEIKIEVKGIKSKEGRQNGDLQLSLSKKIKMTDYKMDPPVMLLGTIKVGNEVTVEFDFVLVRKS